NAGSSTTNANYASVGVRPDLQFGTNSFSVSMWVQLPSDYTGADLPFFCDVVGSTFGAPGFCFEPSFSATSTYAANTWYGGWGFSVLDAGGNGAGVFGDIGSIISPGPLTNGWHSLVYVIDRVNGASVYLDGVAAHQNLQVGKSVVGIGNINSAYGATIGQDPTGLYGQPSGAYSGATFAIDDLGVWTRALTSLEAASIYIAGVSNQVSFEGLPSLSIQTEPGSKLQLTWSAGNLQATTNLSGTWTNVVGATSPYTNSPIGTQMFFRVEQ
ncbi:MAG TPA: LamG-like jellyroll fold domain-containing protein, partial [Verrucomicrobiae bacterium]|nr:LamG-like jellyroll fold domain-containing protein [Verrucomicrobiae bacterium]